MKFSFCFLILSFISTTGCVSTQYTALSNRTYKAVLPEDVAVYLTENDIKGD